MVLFRKIFEMLDMNKDGTVDFNELLVVVVLTSRLNDIGARLAFAFDTFVIYFYISICICDVFSRWDESGDGQLDQGELANVISAIVSFLEYVKDNLFHILV
jgi:Ca2+-binding EF-hand superfamily protein